MSGGNVAVLGGGAWGTALAIHCARQGRSVRLWIRERELTTRMRERRDNPVFLPGVAIPEGVRPTHEIAAAAAGADLVVGVVPAQFARSVYRRLSPHLAAGTPVVVAAKGIEEETLALPLEVAGETLGAGRPLAVLSGPSFALEVAKELPTAVVLASRPAVVARQLQPVLSGGSLRVYTNDDPMGVQLAGALKNVIAVAAGVVDGLEMGHNVLAALITRGLAEIGRLGAVMGARRDTFAGLAGMGDLVLTCTGDLSRNRKVGQALARGERLKDIIARTSSVAEGVRTARSARDLARRHGVEMPIVNEVYRILYEDGSPRDALSRLMDRPLRAEVEGD